MLAYQQIPALQRELAALEQARSQHGKDLNALSAEVEAAWRYLASVVLPELTAVACDAAARLLAFPDVSWASIDGWRLAEQRRLNDELASVEAAPAFQRREAILNECDIRLAELTEAMAPLRQSLDRFERQPLWERLVARGYGTDSYSGRWWSLSYYRDWKHGDMALEALGVATGAKSFAELVAIYQAEERAHEELAAAHAAYVARRDEVNAWVRRHQDVLDRLASMGTRFLARAQGKVIEHLRLLPGEDIAKRLVQHEAASLAYKRVLGVEAKRTYLEQLHAEWVAKPMQQVKRALEKNQRDIVKLSRPKNAHRRFDSATVSRRFADRSTSWNKRWNNYQDSRQSIIVFDDYHLYDPYADTIWWSLMTHDHCTPRFIPDVALHHQHRHSRHDDAVAAVAAGEEGRLDTLGDHS